MSSMITIESGGLLRISERGVRKPASTISFYKQKMCQTTTDITLTNTKEKDKDKILLTYTIGCCLDPYCLPCPSHTGP